MARVHEMSLPGVVVIELDHYTDERGIFAETWSVRLMRALGLPTQWVQDNQSVSRENVIRGLHFQLRAPQAKLVRVTSGAVLDVIVDARWGSPTFGRHATIELTEDDYRVVYIPRGFAHGFLARSPRTVFAYKCDNVYSGTDDQCGIRWNDPTIGIAWNVHAPIISPKDAALPQLSDLPPEQLSRFRSE